MIQPTALTLSFSPALAVAPVPVGDAAAFSVSLATILDLPVAPGQAIAAAGNSLPIAPEPLPAAVEPTPRMMEPTPGHDAAPVVAVAPMTGMPALDAPEPLVAPVTQMLAELPPAADPREAQAETLPAGTAPDRSPLPTIRPPLRLARPTAPAMRDLEPAADDADPVPSDTDATVSDPAHGLVATTPVDVAPAAPLLASVPPEALATVSSPTEIARPEPAPAIPPAPIPLSSVTQAEPIVQVAAPAKSVSGDTPVATRANAGVARQASERPPLSTRESADQLTHQIEAPGQPDGTVLAPAAPAPPIGDERATVVADTLPPADRPDQPNVKRAPGQRLQQPSEPRSDDVIVATEAPRPERPQGRQTDPAPVAFPDQPSERSVDDMPPAPWSPEVDHPATERDVVRTAPDQSVPVPLDPSEVPATPPFARVRAIPAATAQPENAAAQVVSTPEPRRTRTPAPAVHTAAAVQVQPVAIRGKTAEIAPISTPAPSTEATAAAIDIPLPTTTRPAEPVRGPAPTVQTVPASPAVATASPTPLQAAHASPAIALQVAGDARPSTAPLHPEARRYDRPEPMVSTLALPAAQPMPVIAGTTAPAFRVFAAAIHAARTVEREEAPALPPAPLAAVEQARAPIAVAPSQGAPLDMTDRRWPQTMVERIESLRDAASAARDAASTTIRLVPDALGTIDVSVHTDGDTVRVHFAAEQAATRSLIAEAQPRLAEFAEAKGIKLAQAEVSANTTTGATASTSTSTGTNTGAGNGTSGNHAQRAQQAPRHPGRPPSASRDDDPDTGTIRIA